MSLRIYDTMTRTKRDFEPRDPGRVGLYVCGPTVYNHIHIGNARTFLSFDVIRRYLEHVYGARNVTFVRNITDVDDKIINRASEEDRAPEAVASEYAEAFQEAMDALGILPPDAEPRATEAIPAMIQAVERLIDSGHAYVVEGDVYFSVRSFEGYGKLSGRDVDEMRSGARVEVDERKRDPLDFALWKAAKPGEPHWSSPWGEGRPGWHLECSVMSKRELGESFDIHGGATDLIFPHHENEIAQSEADTGVPFARYWMHGGLLQVNQEKMSKSLGNFLLLKEVLVELEGSYPAMVVRLMMLQTHYRSPLDFSRERLDEASVAYERLARSVKDIEWALETRQHSTDNSPSDEELTAFEDSVREAATRFDAHMDDDFNTAGALGSVFDLVRDANRWVLEYGVGVDGEYKGPLQEAAMTIRGLLGILGVELPEEEAPLPHGVVELASEFCGFPTGGDPREAVELLRQHRAQARLERDWATSDAIRDRLLALGFEVMDAPDPAAMRIEYRPRG